jgi:PEP-CTERM motif-containing protein
MKKLILAACALTCAASVFAQGTVVFNNRVVGAVVTHIYGLNPTDGNFYQSGNGTGDTVAGTTDWSAYPLLSGNGFTAQLWAASGLNQAESSLAAASPTTTFRTGAAAGFIAGVTATLVNVAGDSVAGATAVVRVWDNAGGTITSWAMATDPANTHPWGESALFNITAPIGGTLNTPPNLVGLSSFNIHTVPEPSTFALAGLGAAALLIFRRRK